MSDVKIQIITPQFERERGYREPGAPPEDWEALKSMTKEALLEIGMRPWGAKKDADLKPIPGAPTLWLFPGEWYSAIPAGLPIVDICFVEKTFHPKFTDDDIRFGMLSFGIFGPHVEVR